MDKARVYVDLNEMVTDDIVLLSKDDTTADSMGNIITFYEGRHVKWCVRIDWNSLMHESDMKFLQLLPIEIEKHPNDILVLHKFLISFKNHGMDKDSMLKNMEKIKNHCNFKAKDVLMDLMDFVVGWCSHD